MRYITIFNSPPIAYLQTPKGCPGKKYLVLWRSHRRTILRVIAEKKNNRGNPATRVSAYLLLQAVILYIYVQTIRILRRKLLGRQKTKRNLLYRTNDGSLRILIMHTSNNRTPIVAIKVAAFSVTIAPWDFIFDK